MIPRAERDQSRPVKAHDGDRAGRSRPRPVGARGSGLWTTRPTFPDTRTSQASMRSRRSSALTTLLATYEAKVGWRATARLRRSSSATRAHCFPTLSRQKARCAPEMTIEGWCGCPARGAASQSLAASVSAAQPQPRDSKSSSRWARDGISRSELQAVSSRTATSATWWSRAGHPRRGRLPPLPAARNGRRSRAVARSRWSNRLQPSPDRDLHEWCGTSRASPGPGMPTRTTSR